jgi:RNA polymerase sigma-70 factor (ECF subfamily)
MTNGGECADNRDMQDGTPAVTPRPEFTAVYAAELSWVWRTLWRLGVADADLEDAAHDVFVVVHRKLDEYDPARPLRPWLFGICFRTALDRRRRAHVRHERGDDDAVDSAGDDGAFDPHRAAERNEARAVVQAGLARLPLEQRAVFVLHELEGLPVPACADVLGAPINTLYSRLRLARAAFCAAVQAARRSTP